MEEQIKDLEKIDRYLHGQLTDEETADMKQRLQSDEAFCQLYEDTRLAAAGIRHAQRKDTLSDLKQLEATLPAIDLPKSKKPSTFTYLAVAASIAIVVCSYLWYVGSQTMLPADLYLAYYEPYPNIIDPIKRSEPVEAQNIEEGFKQYDLGHYDQAIEAFKTSDNAYAPFYMGIAYMEVGDFKEAIGALEQYQSESDILTNQSHWYLALCNLKRGNRTAAEKHLMKLTQTDNSYAPKAQKLLDNF